MKKAIAFLLIIMALPLIAYAQEITIYVNNEPVVFPDQKPFIDNNNRTLVPVRFISEALGAKVTWDEKTQSVYIDKENKQIRLTINDKKLLVNGEEKIMDTSPIVTDKKRTMVPIRFVSEELGESVGWDEASGSVYIGKGAERFSGINFEQGTGYQKGAYSNSAQPTHLNWSRQSKFTGPDNPKVIWTLALDDKFSTKDSLPMLDSAPVIGTDGTVYIRQGNYDFPSPDGMIYAVVPGKGVKWKVRIGTAPMAPVIDNKGNIYAVGVEDGRYQDENGLWRNEAVAGTLNVITPDGKVKWKYKLANGSFCEPAIGSDGTIYIGSQEYFIKEKRYSYEGYFYAFKPNGEIKWKYKITDGYFDKGINTTPAISADGTIYVGSSNGYLYAFMPDGQMKWRVNVDLGLKSGINSQSPVIGPDGTIYIGVTKVYHSEPDPDGPGIIVYEDTNMVLGEAMSNLYAINPNGTIKWVSEAEVDYQTAPAIGKDGTVYSADRNVLCATNPDGSVKWKLVLEKDHEAPKTTPLIGANGLIYMAGWGRVWAVNPEGAMVWELTLENEWTSPLALNFDGTIWFGGGRDNKLYEVGDGS